MLSFFIVYFFADGSDLAMETISVVTAAVASRSVESEDVRSATLRVFDEVSFVVLLDGRYWLQALRGLPKAEKVVPVDAPILIWYVI